MTSTATAKRAATATIVDEVTGAPSPKMMYTCVGKRMKAVVTHKKYQFHYGSKGHSPDVYNLMKCLMKEHIIDSEIVDNDPILAVAMATAVFNAFNDNFKAMRRPGYEASTFREVFDLYASVLKAAHFFISAEDIKYIVRLLKSIDDSVDDRALMNAPPSIKQLVTLLGVAKITGTGEHSSLRTFIAVLLFMRVRMQ
jgi:hypothetical protein